MEFLFRSWKEKKKRVCLCTAPCCRLLFGGRLERADKQKGQTEGARAAAPWLRHMWGRCRRGRRGAGRLLALLTASALAMMERSTSASGDRVSALKLGMARSLTWPNMHVWVPQLRLDSDSAAIGKLAGEEADAGSKVKDRYATPPLTCADEGSEVRYEGSQPRTSGPLLPSAAADFKAKYVSPLADTILIIKEQERQHMLQAGASQKSEP